MDSPMAAHTERSAIAAFQHNSDAIKDSFQWDDSPEPEPPPPKAEEPHDYGMPRFAVPADPTWRHLNYLEASRRTGGLSPGGQYSRRKSNIEKGQYGPQLSPKIYGVGSDPPSPACGSSPAATSPTPSSSPTRRLFDAETGKWIIRDDDLPVMHQSAPPMRAGNPLYATTTGSSFYGTRSAMILPAPHAPYTDGLARRAQCNSDLSKLATCHVPGTVRHPRGAGSSFMTFRS